ncbi:MAG: hypothetical protein N2595_00440 [bacterium]|nr:hypothetical protein [bacterium]
MAAVGIPEHTLRVLEFPTLREVLAGYTRTPLGRARALRLEPSVDKEEIQRWLHETSEMRALADAGELPQLSEIKDIEAWIETCHQRHAPFEPAELRDIASTLQTASEVAGFFAARATVAPAMQAYATRIGDFGGLVEEIRRCIEPDCTVSDEASPVLGELRGRLRHLRVQIHERLKRLLDAPEYAEVFEERLIVLRNERPALPVKAAQRRAIPGTLLDKSQTGATVFIEPHVVCDLVNELEEARIEEAREVTRILWELTRAIAARREEISDTLAIVGWIDLTVAKARLSQAQRMNVPGVSTDGVLFVHEARHPLLLHWAMQQESPVGWEEAARAVVPLTVELGRRDDVLIITGPNTGGKTVALKTVGLVTLMMQSGMHVPAGADSRLPVFATVLADIGDEQDLSRRVSTFSSHLGHIIEFIQTMTAQTLILLDELGTGTDPSEGAALAAAVLDVLREQGAKVVVTTHLGALTAYAASTPRVANASMEFDPHSMQPTYRLVVGQPGGSNALAIARRLGMPEHVLARAEGWLDPAARELGRVLNEAQEARVAAEASRARAEEEWAAARVAAEAAEARVRAANDAAADRIEQFARDVEAVLADYRHAVTSAPEPHGTAARKLFARLDELLRGTPRAEQQRRFVSGLRPGDRVYLPAFQRYADVRTVRQRQQRVEVVLDGVSMEVPFSQVSERPLPVRRMKRAVNAGAASCAGATPPEQEVHEPLSGPEVEAFRAALAPGTSVYIPVLGCEAVVQRVVKDAGTVVVRSSHLEMTVPIKKVAPLRAGVKPRGRFKRHRRFS